MPRVTPANAIFTTGWEKTRDRSVPNTMRLAMKWGEFNGKVERIGSPFCTNASSTMLTKYRQLLLLALVCMVLPACGQEQSGRRVVLREMPRTVQAVSGAEQTAVYLPWIRGKRVAVVANQTSVVGKTHLVDTLLAMNVRIVRVFAPEHGFRGQAGAGETVASGTDGRTGLPVVSLYGQKKKPDAADLDGVDAVLFDIQDVGVRFYTYISTLQYVMESCAAHGVEVIVLDRPNPNGFYVDGPVLEKPFASFVGLNPIPVVHGLTVAEYAGMLNGEGWLEGGKPCSLRVVACKGYSHDAFYMLPVAPSPNLPNMPAVYLYPSLCLFEGTVVSVGRGTDHPFQTAGYPGFAEGDFTFTPRSIPGVAPHPPYEGEACSGIDLRDFGVEFIRNYRGLYLFWLISFYESFPGKERFFTDYFSKLAGTDALQRQIREGWTEERIRASWQPALKRYLTMRKKYLLYGDFE